MDVLSNQIKEQWVYRNKATAAKISQCACINPVIMYLQILNSVT